MGDTGRLPSLRQLSYFVSVVETGSVSAAADRVGRSQPPVTQQLQVLEQVLGVRLFDRRSRRLVPTEAGMHLFDAAKKLLAGLADTCSAVTAIDRGDLGRLRVGMTDDFIGSALIDRLIADARGRQIELHLSSGITGELIRDMARGETDLVIANVVSTVPPGVRLRPLPPSEIVLLVRSDHALAAQPSVALADLSGEPFVTLPHGTHSPFQARCDALLQKAGAVARPAHSYTSGPLAVQMVAGGLGHSFATRGSIGRAIENVRVMPIDDPDAIIQHGLYHRDKQFSPILDRAIAALGCA